MASSEARLVPLGRLLVDDPAIDSVTVALNYRCQNRCTFCFIERELDLKLPDTDLTFLDRVLDENRRRGKLYRRIIYSGAECTLREDLPDLAHRALTRGGFEVVQIQTNGRKLSDERYLWKLLAAGISEYFVSVHAGTPELDAELTRAPKNFDEMRRGLGNVRKVGARLMSNTAVTRRNHQHLDDLATFLIEQEVPECHFWAFIEYGDIDQEGEHVAHTASVPYLLEATRRLEQAGRKVVISWFPECMLSDMRHALDNHRATLLIHDEFAQRSNQHGGFTCPHQQECPRFDKSCVGLHERYVEVYGDHPEALSPLPPPPPSEGSRSDT